MLNSPASMSPTKFQTPPANPAPSPFNKMSAPPLRENVASEAAATPNGTSVIGSDLTILGERITIVSQNALRVDGHVHGDVHGKQVIISKGGSVDGKVRAEKIEVRGSIIAVAIALHETAKVEGDIMHQKLSISEGAEFDGSVKLIRDTSELTPILDAEVIARQSGAPQPPKQPDFGSLNGQAQSD